MNKYTEIKVEEISRRFKLDGISVDDVLMDGSNLKGITFKDKKGNIIKLQYMDYRVAFFAIQEPKFEEKWVLKGDFKGLVVVKEVFDYESNARKRLEELDDCPELIISKELVEVTNE